MSPRRVKHKEKRSVFKSELLNTLIVSINTFAWETGPSPLSHEKGGGISHVR
jgi:hypothetical protein